MASSQDTEITLGTGKLLVLFFGLVGICALFFALGYSLGRKSEPAITTASAAASPQIVPGTTKASSGSPAAQPMTFYKSVEQKDANPEWTPPADAKSEPAAAPPAAPAPARTPPADAPDPATTLPAAGYFVPVGAVSQPEGKGGIFRAGGCCQQAGRWGCSGGRAQEERVSGVCSGPGPDRQAVSRAGWAVPRH